MDRITGIWKDISTVGERCRAFVPHPLPPVAPIQLEIIRPVMEKAVLALGRLDTLSVLLPESPLFLYMYVRKEAVLSSQIEGTQSTLSDLLLYENEEAPGIPLADDVKEVSNYVQALYAGIEQIRSGMPLSNRLFKELHSILLDGTRGGDKLPGEYRRSQNWLGGTRPGNAKFVPPPPEYLIELLSDLEKFIHSPYPSSLEKAALAHVQFETIHPFLDGNGRIGRLLVPLLLFSEQVLREPLLYLSLYFKNNRDTYYQLLQKVRIDGDWESWLVFFYEGVRITSEQACSTATKLTSLFASHREKISRIGRQAGSVLQVHEVLRKKPILSTPELIKSLPLSTPTVHAAVDLLVDIGMLKEITGQQRNRVYVYQSYMDLLNEGIE